MPDYQQVRKMIEAMVGLALAQCSQAGITDEQFYLAMRAEQPLCPKGDVVELFRRTFARLGVTSRGAHPSAGGTSRGNFNFQKIDLCDPPGGEG